MSGQEPTSFAELLRQHRAEAGLTQEALADRSGLGLRSIQGLELGETRPRRETVRRLVEALRLAPEDAATLVQVGVSVSRQREAASSGVGAARRGHAPGQIARHNLPVQVTSFIGRERELVELRERLGSARLLTLTGTGGCGKTASPFRWRQPWWTRTRTASGWRSWPGSQIRGWYRKRSRRRSACARSPASQFAPRSWVPSGLAGCSWCWTTASI
ncbi:MAG TPA: helix-turn-helix domain-containing protein [Chloroflexota bacterium]|nr:helix-turn-helix domain-containing protein [Chloroflexota bacterium]